MNANDYQSEAHKTAAYGYNIAYPFFGLAEEAGEVLGKVKKFIRHHRLNSSGCFPTPQGYTIFKHMLDNRKWKASESQEKKEIEEYLQDYDKFVSNLSKELGDVLWYVAEIATVYSLNLSDIMQENLAKLADRKARNVIDGEGDNR